jgi:hypothetical protein
MKNSYLKARASSLRHLYLGFLLLCLSVPAALRAQSLTVTAAPNNTLPLQDFGRVPANRTSATQSFVVSGTELTGEVTLAPPAGFQLRVGSTAFSASALTLVPTSGTLSPTAVDVRFAPANPGTYSSAIVVSTPSEQATTTQQVAVSGTAPSGPYIFVDPATLAFGQVSGSGSGQVRTFVVGGGNLGTTPITLTAALTGATTSGAIQVRNPAVDGSPFVTSLTINPVAGQVPETTIQVRIVGPVASQSSFTGTVTASSGAAVAAPTNVVQVTATNPFTGTNTSSTFTVSTPPTSPITPGYPSGGQPLKPFNTVPEKASASQTMIVSGSFLLNGVTVMAPNNFQVSRDAAFTGLGSGGTGTITANSLTIAAVNGTIDNQVVYIRYVPLVAGTESGTGITFRSEPATSIAAIVLANSIGTIESRTVYTKPPVLVIGPGVQTTPQVIRIHAELVRNPTRISVSGESAGALGNPDGYAQFRISKDGVTYTDPTRPSTSYLQLDPDPTTNIIDQDIYVTYAPTRVGAAQAVLQYVTPDVTAAPANTLTPIVSAFSGPDANKLRGTAIDVEPTRETPFVAARTAGEPSATVSFQPDAALTGYGEFHLVLISTTPTLTLPDVLPVDGTDYNAGNGEFQSAGQSTIQDSRRNTYYVVFSGGAATATITGLSPATNYYVYVFDYNSTNPNETTFINNAENYKGPAQTTVLGVLLPGEVPLPVGLTAFTAQVQSPAAVRLAWTTATELNNVGFVVERSLDAHSFETIGRVAGAGTSTTQHTYSLLDAQLPYGAAALYYRLRQLDENGTATYSPVRVVKLAPAAVLAQLLAYPNPAHDAVRLKLLGPAAPAPVEVYDITGRLLRTLPTLAPGTEATLPLGGLPAGLYVLRCGTLRQRLTVN